MVFLWTIFFEQNGKRMLLIEISNVADYFEVNFGKHKQMRQLNTENDIRTRTHTPIAQRVDRCWFDKQNKIKLATLTSFSFCYFVVVTTVLFNFTSLM